MKFNKYHFVNLIALPLYVLQGVLFGLFCCLIGGVYIWNRKSSNEDYFWEKEFKEENYEN